MLFFTNHTKLNKIPNSYIKVSISNLINCTNIENGMDMKSLLPSPLKKGEGNFVFKKIREEFNKEDYKKELKTKEYMRYILLLCSSLDSGSHIVLINHKKEDREYLKIICKFISKKYDYPYYKFTSLDDVDMDKKEKSIFSDEVRIKLQEDISNFMKGD